MRIKLKYSGILTRVKTYPCKYFSKVNLKYLILSNLTVDWIIGAESSIQKVAIIHYTLSKVSEMAFYKNEYLVKLCTVFQNFK